MGRAAARNLLAWSLSDAVRADERQAYDERARHLAYAIGYCGDAQIEWGIRIDPAEPEWPVLYFELPTGQVSYHMPQHVNEWDGHDTPEKNRRIAAFAEDHDT